jgi:hypothetical protein
MKTSKKRLYVAALVIGGMLSAVCSCFGLLALLWSGFPKTGDLWLVFGFFSPFLVSFPLFVLSLGITRLAVFGLWIGAFCHWVTLVVISAHSSRDEPGGFLAVLALCAVQKTTFMLLMQACAVLFGVQIFQDFSFDRFLIRRFGANREFVS